MHKACSWRCGLLREATESWREGMSALAKGQPDVAEALQRKALSLVFSLGGFDVVQARIHNNLGVILSCSGRGAEAGREFTRALYLLRGRVARETRFHQVIANNYRTAMSQQHAPSGHPGRPGGA